MDATFVIDQGLVSDALSTLALNTMNAYQRGVSVKWNDAELAVYIVYIYGEINKSDFCRSFTISHRSDLDVYSRFERSDSILSHTSLSRQRKAEGNRLFRIPSHKTRGNVICPSTVRIFRISQQNSRYAVLRDYSSLW